MEPGEGLRIIEISQRILEETRKGRVQDWLERIAEVARLSNVKLESISWSRAPEHVAIDLVETSKRISGSFDNIKKGIEIYATIKDSR